MAASDRQISKKSRLTPPRTALELDLRLHGIRPSLRHSGLEACDPRAVLSARSRPRTSLARLSRSEWQRVARDRPCRDFLQRDSLTRWARILLFFLRLCDGNVPAAPSHRARRRRSTRGRDRGFAHSARECARPRSRQTGTRDLRTRANFYALR